jgi:hypothetical protein
MKRRDFTGMMMVGLALGLVGCLQSDTRSTIYLKQDGSIDWMVLESNVRSDESASAKRVGEEADYLNAVASDRHPAADSFRTLGALQVRTSLIRDVRPYATRVEGDFDSLTGVIHRGLAACGIPHEIHQTRDGATTTWALKVYVEPWLHDGVEPVPIDKDVCNAVGALLTGELRVMLEAGHFTQWTGFKQVSPDMVAVDEDAVKNATTDEAVEANGGWLVLSFGWTSDAR